MPEIIWTREAVRDLERLFEFLRSKNPDAARKAASQIRTAANYLKENPRFGKPMPDETGRREYTTAFGKKGYIIRYMLDANETPVILRVRHYLEAKGF